MDPTFNFRPTTGVFLRFRTYVIKASSCYFRSNRLVCRYTGILVPTTYETQTVDASTRQVVVVALLLLTYGHSLQ